jgi:hypothetical protein
MRLGPRVAYCRPEGTRATALLCSVCFWLLKYGKIAGMGEASSDSKALLREDLSKEYYAILDVVSKYDGWLLTIKGWSVTLSLAALGLGFQQRHVALFAMSAVTGAAFWYLDGLMKGYQYRYYVRMREIEYTAYLINSVPLGGKYGHKKISAPRIDMTWPFTGYPERAEARNDEPAEQSDTKTGSPVGARQRTLAAALPQGCRPC